MKMALGKVEERTDLRTGRKQLCVVFPTYSDSPVQNGATVCVLSVAEYHRLCDGAQRETDLRAALDAATSIRGITSHA